MSFRQTDLAVFGDQVRWLDHDRARASYHYALRYDNDQHYGLNPTSVRSVERHIVDSLNVALHWLRARIPAAGSVRVVFGREDVFVASTEFFLQHWPNLFCPSRDDVLILANDDDWVLFYCHQDELEFGLRTK